MQEGGYIIMSTSLTTVFGYSLIQWWYREYRIHYFEESTKRALLLCGGMFTMCGHKGGHKGARKKVESIIVWGTITI